MNRALFLILVSLGGAAILVSLGVWQMQRLAWKEAIIADIDARILAEPVTVPTNPDPNTDAYLPVEVSGTYVGETLRVLVSQKQIGPGFRLITAFETANGPILVDRGVVPADDRPVPYPPQEVRITGNLQWPQETDSFTPAPDPQTNVWFARDVPLMAEALGTQPILVVARAASLDHPLVTPLPVDTSQIPNDHLQYAITWFSLAAIWLAMSVLFLRRRSDARPSESET